MVASASISTSAPPGFSAQVGSGAFLIRKCTAVAAASSDPCGDKSSAISAPLQAAATIRFSAFLFPTLVRVNDPSRACHSGALRQDMVRLSQETQSAWKIEAADSNREIADLARTLSLGVSTPLSDLAVAAKPPSERKC